MAILRIAAAAGLLLALAPDQTLRVARAAIGMAEEAKSMQVPAAETAIQYCRANPAICADVARQAADVATSPRSKAPKP